MRRCLWILALVLLVGAPLAAQQTPPSIVAAYDALADTILAVRQAEASFVKSMLDGHRHAAKALAKKGDWEGAAAEMALFANEGDNAIGGVRKRLLEGGHHFNAAGEEQGIFEEGYVVVTREAKQKILGMSTALRKATSDDERHQIWDEFAAAAESLLKGE